MNISALLCDHPIIAAGLILVFILTLCLGVLHVTRLFGEMLLLVVGELEHEALGLLDVWKRLKEKIEHWRGET